MKKIWLASSLLVATAIATGTHVFAETSDTKEQKASVTLTESTNPNTPLLEISSASDLNFGSQAIGINDMNFTDSNNPNIVITDIRGNAPGWNLSASLGEFTDADLKRSLSGVQLFYPAITMTTNASITVAERTPDAIATDSSFSNKALKGVLLEAAATPTSKTLINAEVGKGNGEWTATYGSENPVELNVPAGNLAGNYTATLTYTLADVPVS